MLKPSVLITAGSTKEFIDPVRYISNSSSGKMGSALAKAAIAAGLNVTVICAQHSAKFPKKAKMIAVVSASEMLKRVKEALPSHQIFIGSAAVADFAPLKYSNQKLKKNSKYLMLKLKKTPDILKYVGKNKKTKIVVGFALESENVEQNALKKLKEKNLNFIVANGLSTIASNYISASLIFNNGKKIKFSLMKKEKLAKRIIYEALLAQKTYITN